MAFIFIVFLLILAAGLIYLPIYGLVYLFKRVFQKGF